ncbi:MAG: 2-oxoacid:acceptor oxidoreductase subunit alpha [Rhizobiales bacterium]|nr:2-oxoacid:acceptor oxidoreductase subunit alpha [Hyphomicrobiales bacterium]
MSDQVNKGSGISIALTGSGGAGVMTAGGMLLEAAAKSGFYGLQTRSVGPQIRGGEAAALLRLSNNPVEIHRGGFDILFALDWSNFSRFAAEITLDESSVVIFDPDGGDVPDIVTAATKNIIELPIKKIAADIKGGRMNMIALGIVAGAIDLPKETVLGLIVSKLASKGEAVLEASRACLEAGYSHSDAIINAPKLVETEKTSDVPRWLITGNEAAALGAVRGGIKFAAAYPITPATEILEWLAPSLTAIGGNLVQAEDELSSINMIIGASYGGIPSITATSGPGLALMTESIGLATAAEVPVVIIDVMRGGPSTGIPTKSEQSDLNIAIYGLHGDAPHLVTAPFSVSDCLFTTQWSVHLAEAMQVPAIILSDQFLGQAQMIIDKPADVAFFADRSKVEKIDTAYTRYALTADGVSPMAIPGTAGGQYTADGLEHSVTGTPSAAAEDHHDQLAKRRRKIESFNYGTHWAEIEGEGDLVIVTWGSTAAPVREAAELARAEGISVKTIAVRLLAPLRVEALEAELAGARRVLVIEQNDLAQFYRYLRGHVDLPSDTRAYHHPGPMMLSTTEILSEIMKEHRL